MSFTCRLRAKHSGNDAALSRSLKLFGSLAVRRSTYRFNVAVIAEQDGAASRVERDLGGHEVDTVSRQAVGDVLRHEDHLVDGVREHVLQTEANRASARAGGDRRKKRNYR